MRGHPSLSGRHAVLVVLFALAAPPGVSAQVSAAPVSSTSWYSELLDRYERGDRMAAALALLDANRDDVIAADRELFDGFTASIRPLLERADLNAPLIKDARRARIRAARLTALLHTETMMRAARADRASTSLSIARRSIDLLLESREEYEQDGPVGDAAFSQAGADLPSGARDSGGRGTPEWRRLEAFCRQWFVTLAAWLQGMGNLDDALLASVRGLELFKDDTDLLLARASALESDAATLVVDRSLALRMYPPEHLRAWAERMGQARDALRRTLRAAPGHPEATLRLGRVRQLQGAARDARAAYERVAGDSGTEPFLRYHAWLFSGELEEQAGNMEAAAAAYTQAVAVMPVAQAPLLALSRLRDAAGDTAGARAWLRRSLLVVGPERDDPWWQYFKGQFRFLPARLQELQRLGTAGTTMP